jgi:hypothetical protein
MRRRSSTHGSKLDQLESAFQAMGKRLVVGVEDIAAPVRRRKIVAATTRRRRSAVGPRSAVRARGRR